MLIYSLFLLILLTLELTELGAQYSPIFNIRFSSLILILIDFAENIGLIILLNQLDRLNPTIVKITSILIVSKWIGLGLIVFSIVCLGIIMIT